MALVMRLLVDNRIVNGNCNRIASFLHYASYFGYYDMASYLIDEGARLDAYDKWKLTPLHRSVFFISSFFFEISC